MILLYGKLISEICNIGISDELADELIEQTCQNATEEIRRVAHEARACEKNYMTSRTGK